MADSYAQKFTDDLLGIARGYLVNGGITVAVKTNYGPEIRLGSAALAGGDSGDSSGSRLSLSKLFGVRAAVIVRDRGGDTLAKYGDVPKTDAVRVAVALGVAGLLGYVFVRGLVSVVRA